MQIKKTRKRKLFCAFFYNFTKSLISVGWKEKKQAYILLRMHAHCSTQTMIALK